MLIKIQKVIASVGRKAVARQSRRVSVAYGDEIACLPPCLPAGRDRQASSRLSPRFAMTGVAK
ncbi:MAG: hypothetical protein AUJ72_01825 [Candidatus Omnitrophica bacterium CG1_02_46_14]|nr:MAG: hypothetical protein AUJ72_01825 [Candidatus Omnitrophica bacterium CG1_02_46_14]